MGSVSSLNSLLGSSSTASSPALNLSSLLTAATGATSTGIDVSAAVDAAIYAARTPERQWQAQQTTLQAQVSALTSLQASLKSMGTDLDGLKDPLGSLTARTVTSSNAAVSATASSGTSVGTHTVSVQNVATAASWYSSTLSGSGATLGSSQFSIAKSDGSSTSFTLDGTTTLGGLASQINAAGIGVQASVISDANGSRLTIVGQATGVASEFSVQNSSSTTPTWSSASVSSPGTPLQASTFTIGDGKTSQSISVPAGSTLQSVADQVNRAGLNLTASVVSSNGSTHLTFSSTAGSIVSVSADPALVLTESQTAVNAKLTVDGVPVESASNTVTGSLAGVSFNVLSSTGGSSATLTIGADASQANGALSQFVADYNTAITSVNGQFTFSGGSGAQGVLGGDSVARSLQASLLGLTTFTSPGANGQVSTLADIGLTVQSNGTLSLDNAKLTAVLNSSPQTITNLFQGTAPGGGFAAMAKGVLNAFSSSSGSIAADISNLNKRYTSFQSQINDFESGYIASQQTLLTAMYSKAEIALQQLPATLKQIQAELGNQTSGG